MDRTRLASRIREILESRPTARPAGGVPDAPGDDRGRVRYEGDEEAAFAARCAAAEASAGTLDLLGGRLSQGREGSCVLVERHYDVEHLHGARSVGSYRLGTRRAAHALPLFRAPGDRDPARRAQLEAPAQLLAGIEPLPRLVFFDLETTGLSGGAGTYAFLVGFGAFDQEGFRTSQFLLRGYGEERALLHSVRDFVTGLGDAAAPDAEPTLVTYNGRAFDLPIIDTRFLMQRVPSPFEPLPHLDMLFPARRLWRRRLQRLPPPDGWPDSPILREGDARASCALGSLEQDILGLSRVDDVPGWEIPQRFFTYARTGDASALAAVMEHNRLDLLSLAAVTALILEMAAEQGPGTRDRHDCLALARLYEYLGVTEAAERCYARAAEADGLAEADVDRQARGEALHWIALRWRRLRRFEQAAEAWGQLAAIPGIARELRREALEALAIHHEHRRKDLAAANEFARQAARLAASERSEEEIRHRLGRLSRKLARDDRAGQAPRLGIEDADGG